MNKPCLKMGSAVHSAKRGAHGPSPARKNRLWETSAARKGSLVVMDCNGNVLSSKTATQEQLATYAAMRVDRLMAAGMARGALRVSEVTGELDSRSRRWLRRMTEGKTETFVHRATARCDRMLCGS